MALPKTRKEFKEYCLRALGKPVIELNLDDDQVEDRIDEALQYYADYHFDATEKIYYKVIVEDKIRPGSLSEVQILDGGTGYSNSDTVVVTSQMGSNASCSIVTDSTGKIIELNVLNPGTNYQSPPEISITTSTGSGASFKAYNGGYVVLPENIIGAISIFSLGDALLSSGDMFSIRYQLALNDLYTLTSTSMVPYYMARMHLSLIEELLVGKQPVRYTRHSNRFHIDMDWGRIANGNYLIIEAYEVLDPNVYKDVWKDRWLYRYATALIKKQWGNNLKKFGGIQLAGGVTLNGQQIYDEAQQEILEMEREMINTYSLPAYDMIS